MSEEKSSPIGTMIVVAIAAGLIGYVIGKPTPPQAQAEAPDASEKRGRGSITVTPIDSNVVADIGILKEGVKLAHNRDYFFTKIPKELEGLNFVRMEARRNGQYRYHASAKCKAYVFIGNDPDSLPEIARKELISTGWTETEYTLTLVAGQRNTWSVFEKVIPKGQHLMESKGSWPYTLASRIPMSIKD